MAARKNDKYIPLYFVGAFMVVFVVNMVFVYMATKTHTGVVTENAYEKGLDYNEIIELADTQENLEGEILLENDNIVFKSNLVEADVNAHISRPTRDGLDYEIKLAGTNGVFTAKANFPMQGQWKITIVAKWEDKQYQQSKTVIAQ